MAENLIYANGKFTGDLTDEPLDITGKHAGSSVTVGEAHVDDWEIRHAGSRKAEGGLSYACRPGPEAARGIEVMKLQEFPRWVTPSQAVIY